MSATLDALKKFVAQACALVDRLTAQNKLLRADNHELTELYDRMCVKYDQLRKALEDVARTAGQSDTRGDYIAAVSLIGDLEQIADKALQGKDSPPAPATDPASAVCVWTRTPYTALYSSCCDEDYLRNVTDSGMCHRCGLPIKFAEAAHDKANGVRDEI